MLAGIHFPFFYLVPQLLKLVGGDPVSVVPDQDNDRIIPVGDIDLNMQLAAGALHSVADAVLYEGLERKLADQEVLNIFLCMDLPGIAVAPADHLQFHV